ncbi:exopolysaccharide biosynthesis polyprenyl glycosylphosphotransferase [Rhodoblastus sp. 17X3]|uniref:exopolysaccharide biosynthesis polyprenyl glycosylphosphotransferase n=1 Tax=Rhodoblastus sp. 17X3 TaxID=3047026 RepID=UPI0024B7F0F4|nr:exopolysaccharide biosynthesis polyprenyl glycosylphosphotransferase [Rhodoblastus sp. 17X3]MDI9848769.1 exopolysaccharide biosynthesis polyprenyl glycosylphosphotransferase [Rhodoblastus sp. 17X3]
MKIGRRITPENWVALFVVADFVLIAASCVLAAGVENGFEFAGPINKATLAGVAINFLVLHGLLARSFDAYDSDKIFQTGHSIKTVFKSITFTFVTMLAVFKALNVDFSYSHAWFYVFSLFSLLSMIAFRLVALADVHSRLRSGDYVLKAVSASLYCDPLTAEEIDESTDYIVKIARSTRLNAVDELPDLIDSYVSEEIDSIYIRVLWVDAPLILQQLSKLRFYSMRVYVIADERRIRANHLGVSRFGDLVSITAVDRPIDRWGLWLKRTQDVVLASALILLTAPIMAAVAIAIRLESKGPVIFRQKRTGFNGMLFELWKFRSMYSDKSDFTASIQTSRNDPRVTRVGRFIRKTSLDELPQLFNVLQGSMSIVGPRPHAVHTRTEGKSLEELAEEYAARHRVKPGLTGWAQVCGYRGQLDSIEKVRQRVAHDIEYIENWSTWLDIKIIFRTAWLVINDPSAF